jgi:hypothetical protein
MKAPRIAAVLIAASLASGAGFAQVSFDVPANLPIPKSTLTRAEVVADFLIWRASGLYDLNNSRSSDRGVDTNSAEYMQAEAKYAYLHSSPQFAALVEQIKRDGSTRVVVAQRH